MAKSEMIARYLHLPLRHLIVIATYPRAGIAFLFRILAKLFVFRVVMNRDNSLLLQKKQGLRSTKSNVGHAIGDKVFSLTFFNWELLKVSLRVGEDLTAEHFYLNRPLDDVKSLLKLCAPYVAIEKDSLIFDPGCGTAKHLYYFVDRYDCRGVGIDIFPPAISVAKRINLSNRTKLYNCSSLEKGVIESVLPDGCDYVFVNSWLNHVYKYDGYDEFIEKILEICRYLLVITSIKYELKELLPNSDVIFEDIRDGARYALVKGKRS